MLVAVNHGSIGSAGMNVRASGGAFHSSTKPVPPKATAKVAFKTDVA